MNDGDILLRAIIADPADDAPRLAYADWLDEHATHAERCGRCGGDGTVENDSTGREHICGRCGGKKNVSEGNGFAERAKFIRVQFRIDELIALGAHEPPRSNCNITGVCSDCNREADVRQLRRREQELLSTTKRGNAWWNRIEWTKPIGDVDLFATVFRRGFIDEIHLTLEHFMEHACTIAEKQPVAKWVITDLVPWKADEIDTPTLWNSDRNRGTTNYDPSEGDIRNDLFVLLKGGMIGGKAEYRHYEKKSDLLADLQQACYHYARQSLPSEVKS